MPDDDALSKPEQWAQWFWSTALSDPRGRFVVSELLDLCGARQPRFIDSDYIAAAKRDGKAEIGDFIESELERHCPDRLLQMMSERRARIERARKNLAAEDKSEAKPSGRTALDDFADAQKAAEEQRAAKRAQQNRKSDK